MEYLDPTSVLTKVTTEWQEKFLGFHKKSDSLHGPFFRTTRPHLPHLF